MRKDTVVVGEEMVVEERDTGLGNSHSAQPVQNPSVPDTTSSTSTTLFFQLIEEEHEYTSVSTELE